jgi:hypothetical protein
MLSATTSNASIYAAHFIAEGARRAMGFNCPLEQVTDLKLPEKASVIVASVLLVYFNSHDLDPVFP